MQSAGLAGSRPQSVHFARCAAGNSVSFGDSGFELLLALRGLLIQFAKNSILRCRWPIVREVNVGRQVGKMIAQLGLIQQAAFTRLHGHLGHAVDFAVESS